MKQPGPDPSGPPASHIFPQIHLLSVEVVWQAPAEPGHAAAAPWGELLSVPTENESVDDLCEQKCCCVDNKSEQTKLIDS